MCVVDNRGKQLEVRHRERKEGEKKAPQMLGLEPGWSSALTVFWEGSDVTLQANSGVSMGDGSV